MNDIQKGLEQDARLVDEHVPTKLTVPEIEKVIESLKQFMTRNDYSQARIARYIGCSSSVVSEFLRGKYLGDIDAVGNKVINLMNSVTRKHRQPKNEPFISTTIAKRIRTIVTQTEAFSGDEGKIALVIGDGGHGKSHCLREYARANRNSVYIELDETMNSTNLFSEIADHLKIDSSGALSAIAKRLTETLRERQVIIILDEASGLSVKKLNQLRQIIVVKAKCPLILAGNCDLLKTVNQSSTKRGYESLDQFTSRLMAVLNLDELACDNDGGLYTAEDVRNLYEYGGIKLSVGAVNTIKRICKTPKAGRLRTCNHIIAALHTAKAVDEKGVIDTPDIIAAVEQLQLPISDWLPLATIEAIEETCQAVATAG